MQFKGDIDSNQNWLLQEILAAKLLGKVFYHLFIAICNVNFSSSWLHCWFPVLHKSFRNK